MLNRIREFLRSEDGPTATEYAVMLALIVLAAIGAMTALGGKVNTIFTNVEAAI
jgi:pilus assembly protein Flp/PilA